MTLYCMFCWFSLPSCLICPRISLQAKRQSAMPTSSQHLSTPPPPVVSAEAVSTPPPPPVSAPPPQTPATPEPPVTSEPEPVAATDAQVCSLCSLVH